MVNRVQNSIDTIALNLNRLYNLEEEYKTKYKGQRYQTQRTVLMKKIKTEERKLIELMKGEPIINIAGELEDGQEFNITRAGLNENELKTAIEFQSRKKIKLFKTEILNSET